MIIKPIELANVCSIFPSLRTGRISQDNLKKLAQDSKLIDSDNSIDCIIEESINSGLITPSSGFYLLTKNGKRICKHHKQPGYQLATQTKDIFIKYVLLNVELNDWCCSEFISQFKVDTILQTFVYDRNSNVVKGETNWLIVLSSVGLLEVDKEKAIVNRKYLGIINEMLLKIRNPIHIKISEIEDEKNEVGDLAEKLAMQYEMERLSTSGYPSLALLVQQISKIDQSAGYDILSFVGNGPQPNKNIYIEVKCTKKDEFSFYWSYNEMNIAKKEADNYWVYGYTKADIVNRYADGPIRIKDPISSLAELGYNTLPLDCYISK